MRVLGLDLSTQTGFAFLDREVQSKPVNLFKYGLIVASPVKNYPLEEFRYLAIAERISIAVGDLISDYKPNLIYIEQSNKGKNRHSQKFIEFIHCEILIVIKSLGYRDKVSYVDSSFWRNTLGMKLSKEQRAHNKAVKEGKVRGKITFKHLSVNWVNATYNQNFILKDNDITDAICVAATGLIIYDQTGQNILDDKALDKALF